MLALAVALVPYTLLRLRGRRRAAVPYAPLERVGAPPWRRWLAGAGLAAEIGCLLVAIVAAAGPHRGDTLELVGEEGLDVALVLDISASMQADDFTPTRLAALKELATDFVRRSGGNRVAIYAFAAYPFVQSPLTTDRSALLDQIAALDYHSIDHGESGGTQTGDALLVAGDALLGARLPGRDQTLVLITDGESFGGVEPALAARWLREQAIHLEVVGIGGDEPVEVIVDGEPYITSSGTVLRTGLDETSLIELADATGGRYQRARDQDVLAAIFAELGRRARTPLEVERVTIRNSLSPVLALAAALLFASWLGVEAGVLRRPIR